VTFSTYLLTVLLLSINTLLGVVGFGGIVWSLSQSVKAVIIGMALSFLPIMAMNIWLNYHPLVIFEQDLQK
jgi:hypothetical protein